MDNQNNSNQGCGCSDGCCPPPPKKNNPLKLWIFIAIVIATAAIVTVKLVNKDDTAIEQCCDKPEDASCCPQSKTDSDE